jgi:YVTN family beta-propeller protein
MTDGPDAPDETCARRTRRRTSFLTLGGGGLAALAILGAWALGALTGAEEAGSGSATHDNRVTGTIWVANEAGNSLTAIDAATNKAVTTVTGVQGPHNVQVTPDGTGLWTVSGHDSYAAMLDSESLNLHGVVPTGSSPAHVVLSPDGRTVYTTNGDDGTVSVIDPRTMRPIDTIKVGEGPHGLRPSPDGRWIYVANMADGTLSVINGRTNTTVDVIKVGEAPAQVAFSPDGRYVYASLNGEDSVAKVDVASRTVVGTVAVGDGPIQTFVSGDDRYLLVANQGSEGQPGTTVSIIDTRTFTVTATVETGKGAHGIVVDPTSQHAYITNIYDDDVAVLDLTELQVVARIPVGDSPNGVSFSPIAVDAPADVTLQMPAIGGGADHSMNEEPDGTGGMDGMDMD